MQKISLFLILAAAAFSRAQISLPTLPLPTSLPTALPSAPTSSSSTAPASLPTSLPISLPTSLPISIPTSLPISLASSIPISLPRSLPISLPTSVPITLPTSLPVSPPLSSLPVSIPVSLPTGLSTPPSTASPPLVEKFLQVPAIVTGEDSNAKIECWRISTPFMTSKVFGTAITSTMQIGNLNNATFATATASSDGGVTTAPFPMLAILMSGVAHFTLPHGKDEVVVPAGGMVLLLDTTGTGHGITFPSDAVTQLVNVALSDVPPHSIVASGACADTAQIITTPSNETV